MSLEQLRRGELNEAFATTDSALRVFPKPTSDWYWRFTALKAEILLWQGLSKQSLILLDQDLPSSLSTSDTAVWSRLTRASAHTNLQAFTEAARDLAEAEALARANHPELLGQLALRRGTLAYYQGDLKTAILLVRSSLQAARERKDSYLEASALGSLGRLATKQEHYDESVDWNNQALLVAERAGAKSLAAKIRVNTGWNYFELGDYQNSLTLFQQAGEAAGRAGLLRDQVMCRTNVGAVEYYLRDYGAAETESQLALELARELDEKQFITEDFNNLSSVALENGKIDLAEEYNAEALSVSRTAKNRPDELSSILIAGQIEAGRRHYQRAKQLLDKVMHDPEAETALRWEAEARLASVYADEKQLAKAERQYRGAIGTIETARSSVSTEEFRLTFLSSAIEFYEDYVDFLVAHGRPKDALNVAELSRARTLAEGLASATETHSSSTREVHPQQIAQKLQASLLFYWIGHKNSYLWVITPAKTTYFKLPKASDIEPLVKAYREALPNVDDAQDVAASGGKKLYAMLVEPAKRLIPPGSRVMLLPAESLYGLNFETLIVPEPKPHFWIEDVTLTTANSLALLDASIQRPAITGKNLLLVGDVVPTPGFPALPQAPVEIQKVGHYFSDQNRKVLEAKQATATAYLSSNPGQYAYLHFVTHGTASITRPLESAVILSPEGDVYKLYARDIVTHRLNAQLVTISACNGAGTRAYSGEGLVGLSWAFLRAGAHNVIGALWEVSDASTPQLMDAFYRELFQGKDTATALRDAKLSLLHTPDPDSVFKRPNYWAPFQLYAGS
jgi:CHAT domain-containing protein